MPAKKSESQRLATTVSELLYGVAGWLLVGLGVLGIVVTSLRIVGGSAPVNLVASAAIVLISVVLVLFGVFVNPRFRRRLDRRHSLTRFGRVRSVDERVLRTAEGRTERCVSCDSRLDQGLVRRYREEVCLAGVPIVTSSVEHNHYCVDCATTEFAGPTRSDDTSVEPADEQTETARPATERH
ncbi:hypothetical protein [Halococcus agarilyticus]|uniref:hypothetical protein n=1 Tax=Halococcus agarilyticus TaxID=1232219 RepID=UPI0006776DFC|nr:hypothetical protein [Halococcus agarilyticus]